MCVRACTHMHVCMCTCLLVICISLEKPYSDPLGKGSKPILCHRQSCEIYGSFLRIKLITKKTNYIETKLLKIILKSYLSFSHFKPPY